MFISVPFRDLERGVGKTLIFPFFRNKPKFVPEEWKRGKVYDVSWVPGRVRPAVVQPTGFG